MNKENIEKIMNSSKLTMMEKMEAIKGEIKKLLADYSYLDLFRQLKKSKLSKKSKDLYSELYEQALEDLLEEKKKSLTIKELDEILDTLQDETNKTIKFIKDTNEALLPSSEIKKTAQKLTEEDYNYKRLAVAVDSGKITDDQRKIIENESRKVDLIDANTTIKLLSKYEGELSTQYSTLVKNPIKK